MDPDLKKLSQQAHQKADADEAAKRDQERTQAERKREDEARRSRASYVDDIMPRVKAAVKAGLEQAARYGYRDLHVTPEMFTVLDSREVAAWIKALERLGFHGVHESVEQTVDYCDDKCSETRLRMPIPRS